MKSRNVLVIARKEFMDTLRDRRTLLCMLLLPLLLMPLLVVFGGRFLADTVRENEERILDVAVSDWGRQAVLDLADSWRAENGLLLLALMGRMGVEASGGLDGLLDLARHAVPGSSPVGSTVVAHPPADDAEVAAGGAGTNASASGSPGDEDTPLRRALASAASLTADERRLLQDAEAIESFLSRTRFVPLAELDEEGDLARGLEVPDDLPEALARPAVALALQRKTVAAALHLPREVVDLSTLTREVDGVSGVTRLRTSPTVAVHVLYDSSQPLSDKAARRFVAFMEAVDRQALRARLTAGRLAPDFARPARVASADVATASRQFQGQIGGILPYMLFSFCFFGALYPALDITAGEKERFTLETLLLAPVGRGEIAVGKFIVVFLAGIIAALLSTASLVASITYGLLPEAVLATLDLHFEPRVLLLTASLVLPIAAMYAALLLAVGLYARSFKEAQSYTVPLQLVLLIPMVVSFFPDLQTQGGMAWIPFVNVAMLLREVFKGEMPWTFYLITLTSTLLLTGLSLWIAARMFRREEVLLRA